MMGERTVAQEQLFYEFSLERHMPTDHLLRSIDRFVDLSSLREHLRPFYSRHARERRDDALLSRQQVRLQCLRIEASLLQRRVPRSIHEGARDMVRDLSKTDAWLISRRERKKVEMLFAHLKRILKLDRLRLRGPCGARDEFHLAAAAQNLRKMAKLIGSPKPIRA